MSRIAHTPASGHAARRYWDIKAAAYPHGDQPAARARGERLRALAQEMGVRFDVPAIIDIGCGTGVHALPLSRRAGRVVAVDLSDDMLVPLREASLPNIETHALDWAEVDLDALHWRGAFDLAWAVMTPAVGTPALLASVEAASRAQCCAMVWGARRHDPLLSEAFALHGVRFEPPGWSAVIAQYLQRHSRRHVMRSVPDGLQHQLGPAALIDDLCAHLVWLGIEPDRPRLVAWAAEKAVDGRIARVVDFDLDVWVWSVA